MQNENHRGRSPLCCTAGNHGRSSDRRRIETEGNRVYEDRFRNLRENVNYSRLALSRRSVVSVAHASRVLVGASRCDELHPCLSLQFTLSPAATARAKQPSRRNFCRASAWFAS